MKMFKPELASLTVADLKQHPVWEFGNFSGQSECELTPVTDIPCLDMAGRLVGTECRLADGTGCWGVLGGISPNYPEYAEFLLSISMTKGGEWFHLSRPHQFDYERFGPLQLAVFLEKPIGDVFPISFDISEYVIGKPNAVLGQIQQRPSRVATLDEIFEMRMRSD